jgi:hypothetical protein
MGDRVCTSILQQVVQSCASRAAAWYRLRPNTDAYKRQDSLFAFAMDVRSNERRVAPFALRELVDHPGPGRQTIRALAPAMPQPALQGVPCVYHGVQNGRALRHDPFLPARNGGSAPTLPRRRCTHRSRDSAVSAEVVDAPLVGAHIAVAIPCYAYLCSITACRGELAGLPARQRSVSAVVEQSRFDRL